MITAWYIFFAVAFARAATVDLRIIVGRRARVETGVCARWMLGYSRTSPRRYIRMVDVPNSAPQPAETTPSREPLESLAARYRSAMSDLQDAHVALRSTDGWKSEEQQVITLCFDFIELVRTTAYSFTRYPDAESWLLQSAMDEFVESAIAIWQLTDSGIYNPAYRELRYLLESTIKFSYVDQKLPGPTPLPDRQRWLHANVPRGSISVVTDLSWYVLPESNGVADQSNATFGQLSGYVHPSLPASEARRRRTQRQQYIGLEGVQTLRKFRNDLTGSLDLIAALILNGVGAQFAKDILEVLLAGERFRFERTQNVAGIIKHLGVATRR